MQTRSRIDHDWFTANERPDVDVEYVPEKTASAKFSKLASHVNEKSPAEFTAERQVAYEDESTRGNDAHQFSEGSLDSLGGGQDLEHRVDHDDVELVVPVRNGFRCADDELHVGYLSEERGQFGRRVGARIHAAAPPHATRDDPKEGPIPGTYIEHLGGRPSGKFAREPEGIATVRLGVAIRHQRRISEMRRPEVISLPMISGDELPGHPLELTFGTVASVLPGRRPPAFAA
jgi:hypothetical protein